MKQLSIVALLLGFFLAVCQASDNTLVIKHFNVKNGSLALRGYDPVSYFSVGPLPGKAEYAVVYEGIQYRFANSTNMAQFSTTPEKFLPAFGGWCAWAMLEGEKVDVDPERYKIINGTNFLFYDGFWGNTLKKWNKRAKKETEKVLVRQAEANWQRIISE